jgi:hypothetical protein
MLEKYFLEHRIYRACLSSRRSSSSPCCRSRCSRLIRKAASPSMDVRLARSGHPVKGLQIQLIVRLDRYEAQLSEEKVFGLNLKRNGSRTRSGSGWPIAAALRSVEQSACPELTGKSPGELTVGNSSSYAVLLDADVWGGACSRSGQPYRQLR